MMITAEQIKAIKTEELFNDQLKVKRMGLTILSIIGYNYGEEEIKLIGFASDIAKYLNEFFGYQDNQAVIIKQGHDIFGNDIVLGKDNEGYHVYNGKSHNTYRFGSDKMTAERNYNSLIHCEACKKECYCDIL
jgi:hypothetical protein